MSARAFGLTRLAVLAIAGLVTHPANAWSITTKSIDPALFQDLKWRSIGPFRGGRVLAVAGAPDDARRFYFGAVNGGVWKTEDAGRTWTPIFDNVPVGSIGAIAVAPTAPNILFVGTGEADMRSDIAQGIGLFKSTDGGATWHFAGLGDTQQIGKILVDPRDPNVVLVAALGHPYGPNAERGVFRSTDGGKSWTRTLFKDVDTGAIDLAFQPGNPDVVYAALWQTRRPPWNVYPPSSGPGGGLYKSTDGGKSWTALGQGLPASPGRIGIALSASRPNRVYALVDADQGGLYRSDDAGASWTKMSEDKRVWQRGWYFGGIAADPTDADRVWVCDTVMLRSDDGGAHFAAIKGDPTGDDFHTLWIDQTHPDRRILGVDQGALVTLNGGATWSSWFNQPTGQFYHVVTDNRFPYRVYGAQQDSGAASVPSRSDSTVDGINMTHFRESAAGGESDEIAPDPDDPDTVYGGRVDRLDLRSGQVRSVDPTMAYPDAYRGTWTLPLTFGKRDHALYFANQRIFRTSDGGERWHPISPDLTRASLTVPATLDPATAADTAAPGPRRGVVYDIGTSSLKDGLIWAGTDDGLIWRTVDGGAHWSDVTPKTLAAWSKVGTIEPSHFDADGAYAAIDRHRLDDFHPYLLRTRDGGKSWQSIASGLADGGVLNTVNVVREDPVVRGLLFAGTERGLFVSFDDGDHWQPLQHGLPTTSVRDVTIHGNDLVIATHGRGFYVLDDIAPLRGLVSDRQEGPRLFTPPPAIRVRAPQFTGTPMPKDEPLAVNPAVGAMIDYIVPSGVDGPVDIVILDASGQRVNHFSSADKVAQPDPVTAPAAVEWIQRPLPPAATPGHHRFVWPLHYAAAADLKGEGEHEERGLWAPPGHYTVEINIAGHVMRQPLDVQLDPRVKVTPGAAQAEFAMAREIERARIDLQGMAKASKVLKDQLAARASHDAPGQASQLKPIIARLDSLIDEPPANPRNAMTPPPRSLTGLTDLRQRLDKLQEAVDDADGAPTADAISGFRQARAALVAARQELTDIESQSARIS
jgi:photosystem II stability/assembly factor-like uncharacterized protein